MKAFWICVVICATGVTAAAAQFTYSDTRGTVTLGTNGATLTITGAAVGSPAGTVTMSCPITYAASNEWSCTAGSISLHSTDGLTTLTGSFRSGLFTLLYVRRSGRIIGYNYALHASITGSLTVSGKSSAVVGSVSQTLATLGSTLGTGTIQTGLIDVSQRYEPIYIADTGNNRVVQSADILGSNWTSLGKLGSGVNQFSGPWGVALDSAHKIYVSDSGNCRIVRMDTIGGVNWASYGTCGSGSGHFSKPEGIFVDSAGRIYVADAGNNRIVRMNDMTGSGWVALGTLGSGPNQFSRPSAVATDASGNIYIADSANARIVEVADMSGKNWTELQLNLLYFPFITSGVAVDSADRIYTTDSDQSQFVRFDDITGFNQITLTVNSYIPSLDPLHPTGIFVDRDRAAYLADTGNNRVERYFDMSFDDVFALGTSGNGIGQLSQPHGVVALPVTSSVPVAVATPSALAFPTKLVGVGSPSESTVLTDIGTASFTVSSVTSSSADFPVTANCPKALAGGQYCSASVTFRPTAGGLRKGTVTFNLLGVASKSVSVSGNGALITVSPSSLVLYEGKGGIVTVKNPLTASTVVSVKISGPTFTEANNCGTLAPGASCQVSVGFTYTGVPVTGTLTVTDSSGTAQYVSLSGL